MRRRARRGAACGIALLQCLRAHAAAAPPPPDAGQTLRELQQQPAPAAPDAGRSPLIETDETGESQINGDLTVAVTSIRISGNRTIADEQLAPLVAGLVGARRSLNDLRAAAARITAYYRHHGYAVARAYLPAQTIENGVVWITVLEGRIDQIRIDNHSRLSDQTAHAYLEHAEQDTSIKTADVDRGLLLLNDTPGVSTSRAALQPGASVGTSDLVVVLDPAATYSGNAAVDDYGNRYTGQYRLGGTLNVNSPLEVGDLLSLGVLTSGEYLQYGRIAYQLPVGADGIRVGAAFFDIHYHLGKDFKVLDAHGDAQSGSLFIVDPFIRGVAGNLTGTASWEVKNLSDSIDGTTVDKRVYVTDLGLAGSYRDGLLGGGLSALNASLALGTLDINSVAARLIDDDSAHTRGGYIRLSYGSSRLQRLGDGTYVLVAVSGQLANKNLDSSEKFLLGGIDGVRAYPQGEGVGDTGYIAKLELRRDIIAGLQAIAFYDDGSVTIDHSPFVQPATVNTRDLAGAGVGINAALSGFAIKSTVAWRTRGGEPDSIPRSAVRTPTVLVELSKEF